MGREVASATTPSSSVATERRRSRRTMQVLFAALSLLMLIAGLTIDWLAAAAGLPREIIDIAAHAMLLAAVAHASAIWLWQA